MKITLKIAIPVLALSFTSLAITADESHCGNNQTAQQLVALIKADKQQTRSKLKCDLRLVAAAQLKVQEMVDTEFLFHGRANGRLRDQGVELPKYYGIGKANQVEALAGGQPSPSSVWRGFKNSASHAQHLLGLNEFYQEQDLIGAAFLKAPTTIHEFYWVVYIAKEDNASEKSIFFGPIPNKSTDGTVYLEQD